VFVRKSQNYKESLCGDRVWKEGKLHGLVGRICKPKEEDGLGIIRIDIFNKALLEKWLWRLESPETALWKDVL